MLAQDLTPAGTHAKKNICQRRYMRLLTYINETPFQLLHHRPVLEMGFANTGPIRSPGHTNGMA